MTKKNQEYILTEHDLIVSKTDLKGIITFVNDDLIRITGFSRGELIGVPHNIFRHPDMPKEAYADLWRTLAKSRTWSGLVKNKIKGGGFYWVRANITPIYENGNVVGYMSARRKPDALKVQAAEKVYADINAGHFKDKLNCGEVIRTDIFHTIQRKFENIKIKHKLSSLVLLSVFSILVLASIGYLNLNMLNVHHQSSLNHIEEMVVQLQTAHSAHLHSVSKDSDKNADALNEQIEDVLKSELKIYITQAKMIANEDLSIKQHLKALAVAGFLSVLILLCGWIIRNVLKPLYETERVIMQIANGNYLARIDYRSGNEIGIMMEYLRSLSVTLGFNMAEIHKTASENFRLKYALEDVDTSIIVADQSHKIIYSNKAAVKLFSLAEADVQKKFPNFSVGNLLGANITKFHSNPAQQERFLSTFHEPITTVLLIGGRHLIAKSSPITDEFGVRLGTVAEFEDATDKVNLQNEIATILIEATQGRFKNRITLADKEEFLKLLGTELNRLLEICDTIFGELKHVLSSVALGNLTQKITNDYEGEFDLLKQDTNLAVSQLNGIIEQIKSSNLIINHGIVETIEGNNELSKRTEIQVANLENTASAIHQLAKSARQNDDNAKQANASVNNVFEVVDKGVKIVNKVVNTMESIHESSRKIGDIITTIDSIAFQTNILALNAAVEAARAGEQGRGFAVVAVEVRSLAQRAASAAGEIKTLINDSEEKVEDGSQLVVNAGKIMRDIANSICDVTSMMSRIAVSCAEQSDSIEQVNSNITETEGITQENAQSVVEVIASSKSLEEQIKALSMTIDYFKVEKEELDFQLF
jgi:methyl-accepting chemotaxis protein